MANVDLIEDIYPLTPMQQGMLFHALYAPGSEAYFEQLSCGLAGSLDAAAFRRAWQRVMDRHAVLRTAFDWEETAEPMQVVFRQLELPFEELDWRSLPASERRQRLATFLSADRERGFPPGAPPLMRLALIHLADEEHFFVWSHHHLLLDGWCLSLVLREVLACYDAFRQGRDLHLQLPRPYRDYIAWLGGRDEAAAEAFWRRTLGSLAAPTRLPVVAPAPAGGAEVIRREEARLPAALTASLETFSRRRRVTLSTLFQGAWALLLARYAGEEEVTFGVVVSGRPPELRGAESMVGMFINTLPLRLDVPADQPLDRWLLDLQDRLAEMREHEHTPLVDIQGWSGVPAGLPLFETLLAFENYPLDPEVLERGGTLGLRDLALADRTSYPLALNVAPGEELRVRLSYDARRVDGETAGRLLRHLATLLRGALADPEAPLAGLPILAQEERV